MYEENKCITICDNNCQCKSKRKNRCCIDVILYILSILLGLTIGLIIGAALSSVILGALAAIIILAVIFAILTAIRAIELACNRCKKEDC